MGDRNRDAVTVEIVFAALPSALLVLAGWGFLALLRRLVDTSDWWAGWYVTVLAVLAALALARTVRLLVRFNRANPLQQR